MSSPRNLCFTVSSLALMIISLTVILKKWHCGLREKDFGDAAPSMDLTPGRKRLLQQLRERQQEIVPFYITSQQELSEMKPKFSSVDGEHTKRNKTLWNAKTSGSDIGCNDLSGMTVVDFLGAGYTKTVLKVILPQGVSVALKSVNDQGTDMRSCLEDFKDPRGCQELVSFKLRKEIVLLQRLQHPNIVKLRGQCQDSALAGGVMAVLEQGTPVQMIQLLQRPWEERFRVCLGLVRLLHYLSNSPLGSVALLDFQPRQFVMVSGELKLTDLDDANAGEPACQAHSDCLLRFPLRNFTALCSPHGICEGLNEMRNLYNAYRYFFIYLLPHQTPAALKPLVDQIMNATGELKQSINKTLEVFEDILHVYKSGMYLRNMPISIIKDYAVLKGIGTAGNMEYKCWLSYSHQGCVLSVYNATEAALICNSHPQCTSFSVSGQKTWTGRLLASFRSGFSHLVPDVSSTVYVRRSKASAAVL
ncbi:extracellular tyrosine-protein kinase PKDCC [Electrophorus electricus]|uniref:extracellular tyrosine-protein kinase PKDCC n=1 Tax=Electrophorus electricus TaxID=8005 RepID=UPI0015D05408|nr:extracellular tyrosine-protein kinase PKDCC [Electrophorus electricus]